MTITAPENPDLAPADEAAVGSAISSPAPERPAVRIRRRAVAWLARPENAVPLAIFVVALVIGTWNVAGSPAFQDDEGTYVAQAVAVQNGTLAPYTYWYDHPPLGWIQLAALGWIPQLLGLGGGSDLAAMRYVSAFLFAVTATMIFLLARRIRISLPFALAAATIFVCSPLSLTLGRQVFLDTVGMPWVLLALYLALSPRRALWDHVAAGVAFAIAILSKLTLAAFGPALLLATVGQHRWRGRSFSVVAFLTIGALVIALYPLMALLRGELLAGPDHVSLQDALAYQFLSRSGSGWIWEAGSSRHELLTSWFFLDGYIIVGGVAGALVCAFAASTRWISVAIVCFALPIVASQGYLPAMYIIGALPLLSLAIGAGAFLTWSGLQSLLRNRMPATRAGGPLAAAVIGLLVVLIPLEQWVARGTPLLMADENRDWRRTLEWVDRHLPREDVVVVPYSLWQDVDKLGWNDPWRAIVLEKVDLDSEFDAVHPGGWRDIDWIIDGPTVAPNIDYLGLETARQAYDNSRVVVSFGAWNVRQVHDSEIAPPHADATRDEGNDQ
ncbi:glycosyltransferase family 39 protein [Microbacterium sp.]|uniref:glycosyltransferase family 39 protein n=1 Tax=Microbacterium sp. TaxID=51671 RepID=UPI0039E43FB1